jgi:hypothetical protein
MKRTLLQSGIAMAVIVVIAGCSGGAADNTNGGQVKGAAPITNGANTKTTRKSMVGVRGGLYSAAPGQAHGIPK